MDVQFCDVTYTVWGSAWKRLVFKNEEPKQLLKGVSGEIKRGTLTAIMGPSGAGKSTLMNVLAGYQIGNAVGGTINVNGASRDLDMFRKLSTYIMQDDALLPTLTVMETMMISANLKICPSVSSEEKKKQVLNILEILGMENCRGTRTNMLSGGQRKRVSIALEMVYNPPVMFADEPTTGLDSIAAFQCVKLLKALALSGKTIVCTIHQPSAKIFELFDQIYIVVAGDCLFRGSEQVLINFLAEHGLNIPEHHNPADFAIEVASGIHGNVIDKLVESVKNGLCERLTEAEKEKEKSLLGQRSVSANSVLSKMSAKRTNSQIMLDALGKLDQHMSRSQESLGTEDYATGFFTQFWVLLVRAFKTILRDSQLTNTRFVAHVAVGILVGLMYGGIGNDAIRYVDNTSFLFFCLLFLLFAAMMPTVMTFPMERNVMMREHMNYWYRLSAYYFAKTLADIPFQILFPAIFSIITYFMTNQPHGSDDGFRFMLVISMTFLVSLVAQACGLFIGAVSDIHSSIFVGPISTLPVLLFSGFFVTFDQIPIFMQPFSYLSYVRYGFEATLLSIYGFNRTQLDCNIREDKKLLDEKLCAVFADPVEILKKMDVVPDESNIGVDVAVLLLFFVVIRTFTFGVLKYQIRGYL